MRADASPCGLQTARVTAPSTMSDGISAGLSIIDWPLTEASAREPTIRSVSEIGPRLTSRAATSCVDPSAADFCSTARPAALIPNRKKGPERRFLQVICAGRRQHEAEREPTAIERMLPSVLLVVVLVESFALFGDRQHRPLEPALQQLAVTLVVVDGRRRRVDSLSDRLRAT